MQVFFYQATIYLLAMVIAVPLAKRLGLGSVLGYLIAGIVIGPVIGLVGSETADLQHFAEFGVVMMLFIVGLELEPRALWDMRHRLIGLGGLQIVLTTGAIMSAGVLLLGQSVSMSFAIGLIFALSSTAIVLQTLTEKGLLQTAGGRSSFSVLLTQDIAVIPMLLILPLLAMPQVFHPDLPQLVDGVVTVEGGGHGAEAAMSLVEGLPGWGVTLVTLGAVAAIILGGHYLARPMFRYAHSAKLREIYTAMALLVVVGIAFLMDLVGLSPALGAFLAGVVLANSEFRHELESDLEPFKGLLLGLFFITVGAGIDFHTFLSAPFTILGLTLGVIAIKGGILYILAILFDLKRRDRMLFTLGLAQAGEFGFVLLKFTTQQNVIPNDVGNILLLVVAFSMLLTPLMFIAYDQLSKRLGEEVDEEEHDKVEPEGPIIIAGIGRFGQVVNRLVGMSGYQTTVLDHDLNTIQLMRKFGFKGYFGDPTRPELLQAAGLKTAAALVVALDDRAAAIKLVSFARRERPDLRIVARARDRTHVYELYHAGADDIVRETFDSSVRAGRYVLESMGLTDYEAAKQAETFWKMDRAAMRELAEVWDPNIPVDKNAAYVERSREMNRDLETALVSRMEESGRERAAVEDAKKGQKAVPKKEAPLEP